MRLIDCFIEMMAYVQNAVAGAENYPGSYDQFRTDVERLLERGERDAKKAGISEQQYEEARFAACAWADEVILTSSWAEKDKWKKNQLQREYYHTTNAGDLFFKMLGELDPENQELLEVYCNCLGAGFGGTYFSVRDRPNLEEINQEVVDRLISADENPFLREELSFFPNAYLDESEKPRPRAEWGAVPLAVLLILIAAGALGTLYLGLYYYLEYIVGH